MKLVKLEIEITSEQLDALEVLAHSVAVGSGDALGVLRHLVASAVDGVRRPGSWERGWLTKAFGDDWTSELEPDPRVPWRVRRKGTGGRP